MERDVDWLTRVRWSVKLSCTLHLEIKFQAKSSMNLKAWYETGAAQHSAKILLEPIPTQLENRPHTKFKTTDSSSFHNLSRFRSTAYLPSINTFASLDAMHTIPSYQYIPLQAFQPLCPLVSAGLPPFE